METTTLTYLCNKWTPMPAEESAGRGWAFGFFLRYLHSQYF